MSTHRIVTTATIAALAFAGAACSADAGSEGISPGQEAPADGNLPEDDAVGGVGGGGATDPSQGGTGAGTGDQ